MNYRFLILIIVVSALFSCKEITKATDFITQPTAREVYGRNFEENNTRYNLWKTAFDRAKTDSITVKMPYLETGRFWTHRLTANGYQLYLQEGEIFHAEIATDSLNAAIFLDLLQVENDSLRTFRTITQNEPNRSKIDFMVEKTGNYHIVIQPALQVETPFVLKLYRTPAYGFPVTGKGNAAIQSFWGANRDGGKRSHEGLDIFADRGTPVVAACEGRVRSTGNRGLGGKQVWLRESLFGNALYYAHLDSIAARGGQRVKRGDTLGFVGNTGNARTTPPHLHFGIYQGGRGAINPLPFVFEGAAPVLTNPKPTLAPRVVVTASVANLRASASAKAQKLGQVRRDDTLELLGASSDWLHINTATQKAAFIYHSLVWETVN